MNRFAYDNIDPELSPQRKLMVMTPKCGTGINKRMSKERRNAKQARHRANATIRLEQSGGRAK
jgi:hypothetical protein